MVQIFDMSPTESTASMIGQALGTGFSKRAGLAEAESAFQQAKGDPFKLATAMGRLVSQSPEMARAAGPMYEAMMRNMQGQAMKAGDGEAAPFPYPTTDNIQEGQEAPSITQGEDIQKQIQGYIPPTQQQIINEAGQMYRSNPAMFPNGPQGAVDYVKNKYEQQDKIVQAHQRRHENLNTIQDNVVERLRKQADDLEAKVPAKVMSEIEKDAIRDVKEEGLTEQEAMRKHGDRLDQASRDYQNIKDIGSWGLITNPKESRATLKSLQKSFKERKDQRNFADSLVADLKVSYPTAYEIADPLTDHPSLNKYVESLPLNLEASPASAREKTNDILPKLGKLVAETNASPQAVFSKMIQKGYDPLLLKDYLSENRDKLGLKAYQTDQLGKEVSPMIQNLNDKWFRAWGIE